MHDPWHIILDDLRVELADEFDRNFERKAFFDQPWLPRRRKGGRGSTLVASGKLRRSIRAKADRSSLTITFSSSEPYASLHNEGGSITVSAKMHRFFWAKYYEVAGKVRYRKDGSASRFRANSARLQEAEMWKALALVKVGSKITIPQRRFIGPHRQVELAAERVFFRHTDDIADAVAEKFNRK